MNKLERFSKVLFVLASFFLSLSIAPVAYSAIIIDHTCTDTNQIPAEWITAVKTMVLHHIGESHGIQVPHGLENLENENPLFEQSQSEEGIPAGSGLKITRGQRSQYGSWELMNGPERYWQGTEGRAWTERTLDYHFNNGDTVHASLHTWCWHLRTWSENQVEDYLSSMEILEAMYPDVTFIYMTDTCDSTGDTGYNRWLRNEQIRQYSIDNDKVLFDFADLEAWSADGTEQNTYYHAASGQNIPHWHDDWSNGESNDFGHINDAATTMKAKAMWWLMARLAGWESGSTTSTTLDPRITTTTTIIKDTTTITTTTDDKCLAEEIYGEYSEETEILRYLHFKVLNKTPEGKEIIRLYYSWSPIILNSVKENEEFREELKAILDEILLLIRTGIEQA